MYLVTITFDITFTSMAKTYYMISDAPMIMGFMAYAGINNIHLIDEFGTIESKLKPRLFVFMESHEGNVSESNLDNNNNNTKTSQDLSTEVVEAAKNMELTVAKPNTNGELSPDLRGKKQVATKEVKGTIINFSLKE